MKRKNNYKYWKHKKKRGFHFYFVLLCSIIVIFSALLASFIIEEISPILQKYIKNPDILLLIVLSLSIGGILSFFVGKILLTPIKKLKELMSNVADGNLNVKIEEYSKIDEIEDMYHYFNLMMKELRATEIIQSDFATNVSHELKTPLNAIDGYATLLSSEEITTEEKNKYTQKILYNTHRMNELISNILLLSKVENQAIDTNKKLFYLDEQIRQSIVFLEPKWSAKNINLNVDLETIKFYGNESLMIHVWNNLIDNAIKFSNENSNINIYLSMKKNEIEFIIEDFGPGISEDKQKYIFNKFYQVDTSRKAEGNGLGLSLVKKILDLTQGKISVENILPTGCRFRVLLSVSN